MSATRLDLVPLDLARPDTSRPARPTDAARPGVHRAVASRPPAASPVRPAADRGVWLGHVLLWVGPFAAFLAAVLLAPAR